MARRTTPPRGLPSPHEEASAARRHRRARHPCHEEGAGRLILDAAPAPDPPPHWRRVWGGGCRLSHSQRATIAVPTVAAIAPPPTAAGPGAGVGARSRNGTRWVNRRTSHPAVFAARSSSRSGLTAMAWPTASSIGRSVAESLYAYDAAR